MSLCEKINDKFIVKKKEASNSCKVYQNLTS